MAGRRAKRASKETYLRHMVEKCKAPNKMQCVIKEYNGPNLPSTFRMRRASAVMEWAATVFNPKHGRFPTKIEQCAALDSGEIGRWIDSQYEVKVVKREIVCGDKVIPYEEFCAKPKKEKDLRHANEMLAYHKGMREKHWKQEAQDEIVAAMIAGTLKAAPSELVAKAAEIVEQKRNRWEIEQILDRASKRV